MNRMDNIITHISQEDIIIEKKKKESPNELKIKSAYAGQIYITADLEVYMATRPNSTNSWKWISYGSGASEPETLTQDEILQIIISAIDAIDNSGSEEIK